MEILQWVQQSSDLDQLSQMVQAIKVKININLLSILLYLALIAFRANAIPALFALVLSSLSYHAFLQSPEFKYYLVLVTIYLHCSLYYYKHNFRTFVACLAMAVFLLICSWESWVYESFGASALPFLHDSYSFFIYVIHCAIAISFINWVKLRKIVVELFSVARFAIVRASQLFAVL